MTPEEIIRAGASVAVLVKDLYRLEQAHRRVADAWRDESKAVAVSFLLLAEAYAVARKTLVRWAEKEGVDTNTAEPDNAGGFGS